jgi:hypothetical protein
MASSTPRCTPAATWRNHQRTALSSAAPRLRPARSRIVPALPSVSLAGWTGPTSFRRERVGVVGFAGLHSLRSLRPPRPVVAPPA